MSWFKLVRLSILGAWEGAKVAKSVLPILKELWKGWNCVLLWVEVKEEYLSQSQQRRTLSCGEGGKAGSHSSDRHTSEWSALPTTLPQWIEQIFIPTVPGRHPAGHRRDYSVYKLMVDSRQGKRRNIQSKQSEDFRNTVLQHVPWK